EKIVSGERDVEYLPKWLVGDCLLLVVEGEAVAGVDLAKLRPEDVSVTGRRVTVTLPRSELFSTRIDNEKTRVYSRETGLFARSAARDRRPPRSRAPAPRCCRAVKDTRPRQRECPR